MATPTPPGDERWNPPGRVEPPAGESPYQNAPPYPGQSAYPPPPGYGMPPEQPRNGFGIAALILGIGSLVLFFIYAGIWLGIPAIITGFLGRSRARAGRASNGGMSIAGAVLGIIGLVLTILLIVGVAVFFTSNTGRAIRHCATLPTRHAQQQCLQHARS